ncbi:phosphomannomutase-like [Rosa chinensis]|uniref:phosphomannomutase-like n=1 Tax=Rosa chinensis TaxID=74649 RepID=UPI001AD93507|nr:phosphomannomutase-like [Rosa chinensis]
MAVMKPGVIALFDVDGTLTAPKKDVTPQMLGFMRELKKWALWEDPTFLTKQLGKTIMGDYDYVFSENGLVAHKDVKLICTQVLYGPYLCFTSSLSSSILFLFVSALSETEKPLARFRCSLMIIGHVVHEEDDDQGEVYIDEADILNKVDFDEEDLPDADDQAVGTSSFGIQFLIYDLFLSLAVELI